MFGQTERELFEPTQYVYPKGYFQAQAEFAVRAYQLGLCPNILRALLKYTIVYRHLTSVNPSPEGPEVKWLEFIRGQKLDPDDPNLLTHQIWQFYISQPHSLYRPEKLLEYPNRFGSFMFKDRTKRTTLEQYIELHFLNQRRGKPKSDFSRSFVAERIEDLREMFTSIQVKTQTDISYKPQRVVLVSWMNALLGVQMSLPPSFVASSRIVEPPAVDFCSNALWGQFLNNSGGVNRDRYFEFHSRLTSMTSIDQLNRIFPFPVLTNQGSIDTFFKFFCSR